MVAEPQRWLVTGGAGFIGSHLVEALLGAGRCVRVLDNFATARRETLERLVRPEWRARFALVEGDVRDEATCRACCDGMDVVLHQAALGSVPRSLRDPRATHAVNVDGFVHVALAARDAGVRALVYASSSSVYGDATALPQREAHLGRPLSPYAASKRAMEIYAQVYHRSFGLPTIGLRYFNVVGRRQDPEGPYAAVVPRFIAALLRGEAPVIYGDGATSRDFCPVANVVQANLAAAAAPEAAVGQIFNIALGRSTTLLELFAMLRDIAVRHGVPCAGIEPRFADFRPGDLRHSRASIAAATERLGYAPATTLEDALEDAVRHALATSG